MRRRHGGAFWNVLRLLDGGQGYLGVFSGKGIDAALSAAVSGTALMAVWALAGEAEKNIRRTERKQAALSLQGFLPRFLPRVVARWPWRFRVRSGNRFCSPV